MLSQKSGENTYNTSINTSNGTNSSLSSTPSTRHANLTNPSHLNSNAKWTNWTAYAQKGCKPQRNAVGNYVWERLITHPLWLLSVLKSKPID